jgi:hypothetical protein
VEYKPSLHVVPVALATTKRRSPLPGGSFNLGGRDCCAIERKPLCHAVEQGRNRLQDRSGAAFFHQKCQIAFSLICIRAVAVEVEVKSTGQNLLKHGGSPSNEVIRQVSNASYVAHKMPTNQ